MGHGWKNCSRFVLGISKSKTVLHKADGYYCSFRSSNRKWNTKFYTGYNGTGTGPSILLDVMLQLFQYSFLHGSGSEV